MPLPANTLDVIVSRWYLVIMYCYIVSPLSPCVFSSTRDKHKYPRSPDSVVIGSRFLRCIFSRNSTEIINSHSSSLPFPPQPPSNMADSYVETNQDLTDDQIQQLLLDAETRLRAPNVVASDDSIRIPKLSPGSSLEAYVRQGDDIATVNSAQAIDPNQKESANSLRVAGKKEIKVSSRQFYPHHILLAMRKIFPTQSA